MKLLRDPSLYNILEADTVPYEEIHNKIEYLMENDPTVLHETLNYLTNQAEIYKIEYMRIQALKKQKETFVELIKKEVLAYLEQRGVKAVETNIGKLYKRKSPPKVNIKDIDSIPEEYFKIEKTPSLTRIKEAYKEGKLNSTQVELTESYSLVKK